jgi:peroxiredoxin
MPEGNRFGALLVVAALLVGIYFIRADGLNQPAPDFSLLKDYGGRVDLASYRGRPVLLVFWTSSCSICQHELPMLSRLAPEFYSKGIDIVAINLGGADEGRDYMRTNRIDLTSVADSDGDVGRAYHVSGVPKLVLVGSDGKIKRTSAGWANESVLRTWMNSVGG